MTFGYGVNTGQIFLTNSSTFFQQINDNKGHSFNVNLNIPIFQDFKINKFGQISIQIENESWHWIKQN